jgi:hypothetical protein
MLRSSLARWSLGLLAMLVLLGLIRFKPWRHLTGQGGASQARQQLEVGFLPVT